MLSLCSAPSTAKTSLIDNAKQSANSSMRAVTLRLSWALRSLPILISDSTVATRAGRKGAVFLVRTGSA
ncbi:hypothetical protein BDZ97DRAFT_1641662, partial [Flammula alnicola]